MVDFSDRVVMVTGATGGLGGAVTEAFLQAGARVLAVSRSAGAAAPRTPRLELVEADLATAAGAGRVVSRAIEAGGRLDVLVHLVGGFAGGSAVAETSDDVWDRMLEINLRPAVQIFRAALPVMIRAGGGRIVAVGSRAGSEPAAGLAAYAASKAALHSLVCTVALEGKPFGLAANVVMPGTIDTPANRKAMPEADPDQWVKPASIAEVLLWLASEAASGISGSLIPVYGRS